MIDETQDDSSAAFIFFEFASHTRVAARDDTLLNVSVETVVLRSMCE